MLNILCSLTMSLYMNPVDPTAPAPVTIGLERAHIRWNHSGTGIRDKEQCEHSVAMYGNAKCVHNTGIYLVE